MIRYRILAILYMMPILLFSQPEGVTRFCAEWEPAKGTLIRYPLGIPYELVIELASDDSLYILVEDEQQQNSAESAFNNHGVNLENCRFMQIQTNSHWTRDWGPQFLFDSNDQLVILDPEFDGYPWVPGGRPYDYDDAVNQALGEYLNCEVVYLPAYLTGGNIMTDGFGNAFSTQQMLDENIGLGLNSYEFFSMLQEYAGIDDYRILPNIEDYGIQHIDCGAKLLSEEKVLIKRLPEWHPEYERMEALTAEFSELQTCFGSSYQIIRIDCPAYSGNDCAAYTNSLILNTKVLVSLFGIADDQAALEVYETAMPGYEIIGFFSPEWYYYDALHCRTHEIIDPHMLYLMHTPVEHLQPSGQSFSINLFAKAYSGEDINLSHSFLFWRNEENSIFNIAELNAVSEDTLSAQFPPQQAGAEIQYYFLVEDYSGRTEVMPRGAPTETYSLNIDPSSDQDVNIISKDSNLNVYPNPFNPRTKFSFYAVQIGKYSLCIYNSKGKIVFNKEVYVDKRGDQEIIWNAKKGTASAIYYAVLKQKEKILDSKKCLLLK